MKFRPVHVAFLALLSSFYVKAQQPGRVIFTCCKLQSSLGQTGFCEQPSSEFDIILFESILRVASELKVFSDQEYKLQSKPSHCICGRNTPLSLNFQRVDGQWQSRPTTAGVDKSKELTFDSQNDKVSLSYNGQHFSSDLFCLNKLEEFSDSQGVEKMELEIILCSKSCVADEIEVTAVSPSRKPSSGLIPFGNVNGKDNKFSSKSANCEDKSSSTNHSSNCNSIAFYSPGSGKDLFLVEDGENISSIRDRTYPWGDLYCQTDSVRDGISDFMKFCLNEVKLIFEEQKKMYAILSIVSAIFLLFNLAIYFVLRESLSIGGWTEFMYSVALWAYFILSIPGLLIVPESTEIGSLCYVLGALIQYFELASGATLLTLSFDIFWSFCKLEAKDYTDDPKNSKLRLSLYFIFFVTFPIAVVCYGLAKNKRPEDFKIEDFSGIPYYGLLHCTAPDWSMAAQLQFGMQGLNFLLALFSAYIILNKLGSFYGEMNLDPGRLKMFSKLFVFVAVFWVADFVNFFFQEALFPLKWYLIGLRMLNYSQGIFAFFILVCNQQTIRGFRQKDWTLKGIFQHSCCSSGHTIESEIRMEQTTAEGESARSPLMQRLSFQRSTIRGNKFY